MKYLFLILGGKQTSLEEMRQILLISNFNTKISARFCTTINLIPGFRISAPSHMKVLHIPLLDDESTDLSPYFTTVFKEIDEARKSAGRLLLLCAMGISRSATFAIAYLMCIEKMSLHDAYKHVQYCRNIICPNLYGKKTVHIIEPICG
ncbi:unnamed protein product, partial [Strongylus vulgaris]